jgi:hypothetical protein
VPPTIPRTAYLIIGSILATCAGGAEEGGPSLTPLPELPSWMQSTDVAYVAGGSPLVLPIPVTEELELTTGVVIRNHSDKDLHIESLEIASSVGLSATPELVVIGPRRLSVVDPLLGWPLQRVSWDPEAEHPFGPFDLPAGEEGAIPEVQILIRLEIEEALAHIAGYWIRGTHGDRPFVDLSETVTAICTGVDMTYERCEAYDAEHGPDEYQE